MASVDSLADALRALGHEVICVTPRVPGYRERGAGVVRVNSLPLPTRTQYRLTFPLFESDRILRALDGTSIVHTHSPFVTGWMGARYAKRMGLPLVFTYHTQLEEYAHYVPFERGATRKAATRLTRAYANGADAVIVPTPAMKEHLRELGVLTQIAVVPSGIDVAFFSNGRRSEALRAKLGVAPDAKMILCVGRLAREKNVELALEAFARLEDPTARLVVVGDGPHRGALERAAARFGVEGRTNFALEFAREALPDAYKSADAFLFTSASETQGLVLVEALAANLPVVAVDTPQTRDVMGGAGTLVPPKAEALAKGLRRALNGGGSRSANLSVAQKYDGWALGDRVLQVYASLLGRN